MLWNQNEVYQEEQFESEERLEDAIHEVSVQLFGENRIYLDIKKRIGSKGSIQNIPDGYLVDLTSQREPRLYVVENELAIHEPLKHIAAQILQFSLSFETLPQKMKGFIKDRLTKDKQALQKCQEYAESNGFENIDYLLEQMIYKKDSFSAIVIIDEMPAELETILLSRFKFPVEIITLKRFSTSNGKRLYQFEPFLADVSPIIDDGRGSKNTKTVDPSEIDTIVVPAREDGFREVFIGENCWYAIRIHPSMVSKVKFIAAYRVAPISAITHLAQVKEIKQWKDSNKYILYFTGRANEIEPIKLVPKGKVKALQNSRYTAIEKLKAAKTLEDTF